MPKATTTPAAVSSFPEVKVEKPAEPKEEMVEIIIDKDQTDGGITVNGKTYVGRVKVPAHMVDDLLRMQEEYWETKKKMFDPNVSVRMKNDYQKESLFLADPKVNGGKRGFTQAYGLLPAEEWARCSPAFKEQLLQQRQQLYGY